MTVRELLKSQVDDNGSFTISFGCNGANKGLDFIVEILCSNETVVSFHTSNFDSDQINEAFVTDDECDPVDVSITDMKELLEYLEKTEGPDAYFYLEDD